MDLVKEIQKSSLQDEKSKLLKLKKKKKDEKLSKAERKIKKR